MGVYENVERLSGSIYSTSLPVISSCLILVSIPSYFCLTTNLELLVLASAVVLKVSHKLLPFTVDYRQGNIFRTKQ